MEEKYVRIIIEEAKKAYKEGEVPVGCIIVKKNKIISRAHNKIEKNENIFNHAEILAITKAAKKINNWRLNDCVMYVTLQPCKMCEYAIKLARIKEVKYLLKSTNDTQYKTKQVCLDEFSIQYKELLQSFFYKKRN